ncbi:MAG: PAS domain-containing protein [Microthrixaceae bacterium]
MQTDVDLACLAGRRCPDVLAVLGPDFTARWVSPSVEASFGHDPADLVGLGVADLVHMEDLGPILNGITEAERNGGRRGGRVPPPHGVRWIPARPPPRPASSTRVRPGGR